MVELPEAFLNRMRGQLKGDFDKFVSTYHNPPERAIRVNTLKISAQKFAEISPFSLVSVPWEESGFFTSDEGLGRTPLHAAGAYYVQEPSAMSVVPKIGGLRNKRVLDLCSAPGGKGTQMAAKMAGEGVLVLNEPVNSRRDILAENVERMGVKNAIITCARPEALSKVFENYFDVILVDAPCSGEGMFKKEENAIPEWSLENVLRCAERQKDILNCADKMLCGGGTLAYSTCTFSPEEDEGQVENFLKTHPTYALMEMQKLYPHEIKGEGHFFAVMKKGEGVRAPDFPALCPTDIKKGGEPLKIYREWEKETLNIRLENIAVRGDNLYLIPNGAPSFSADFSVQSLIALGRTDKKNFFPHHSASTRLKSDDAQCLELNKDLATAYLKGLTVECPKSFKGWYLATHLGLPLGWCKAVGGVAKNHYPKGLRV